MSVCPYCGDDPAAPVAGRWEFTLPLVWPSNQHTDGGSGRLGNAGSGRWLYKKIRTAFEHAVQAAACSERITVHVVGQRRVTLTRLWAKRGRAFDHGNLVAGAKPIEDALVMVGILADDSAKYARIHHKQRRAFDGVPAVHVLIEELAP